MSQLFFKINLNKYGELRRKIEKERNTFLTTAISFFALAILLYAFVLYINYDLNTKIDNRKELLSGIDKEIKAYQVSGEFLSNHDLERMARISTERIFWARKLVASSEITADKIAITHFSFKNNVLSLFGITKLDKKQKEFDLIDDFIKKLENNSHINSDFPEIKFVKSYRDFEKDVEILRFQIDCKAEVFEKKGRRRG